MFTSDASTTSQLKGIAGQIKSRINDAIVSIKTNVSSTPLDPNPLTSYSSSSQTPTPSHHEERPLHKQVFNTLFAPCIGSGACPQQNGTDDNENIVRNIQNNLASSSFNSLTINPKRKPTKLGTKARNALQNLQKSSSNDECYYAQYYSDDHGRAAKAVLMTKRREEQEKATQRKKMHELQEQAKEEAVKYRMTSDEKTPTKTHRDSIRVGRYELSEVNGLNRSSASEDSESNISYNYDDGISAISAHTLEEMAKAERILYKKHGIPPKEPKEQGFEITDSAENENPPSPTSTAGSSDASDDDVARIEDLVEEQRKMRNDQSVETSFDRQISKQKGNLSHDSFATADMKTPDNSFSNNVSSQRDGPVSCLHYCIFCFNFNIYLSNGSHCSYIQSVTKTPHPHDTSFSTRSSSTFKSKKNKKSRTPKIFRRRKKYMEFDDDEYEI